jgi:tRNA pseudouridine(55) synthase
MRPLFLRKRVLLTKAVGETPLQAISAWKEKHPRYKDIPATYAGRLDPMASGKLLVLLGDECKKKEAYLGLDKTYEVELLLGVESDTGDVLGVVHEGSSQIQGNIEDVLQKEVGTFEREYPRFSSKTVGGKPLFLYALEGTLGTIDIPTHNETIYSITLLESYTLQSEELETRITSLLARAPKSTEPSKELGADFRINEVKESWEKVFRSATPYPVLKVKVSCGSGAYMRSLAMRVGEALGTKGLALSIDRTKIG